MRLITLSDSLVALLAFLVELSDGPIALLMGRATLQVESPRGLEQLILLLA